MIIILSLFETLTMKNISHPDRKTGSFNKVLDSFCKLKPLKKSVLIGSFFFIIILMPVMPVPGLTYTTNINWYTGEITIDLEAPLKNNVIPIARTKAMNNIERVFSDVFLQEIKTLYVDSSANIKTKLLQQPEIFSKLVPMAMNLKQEYTYLSRDFSTLHARYNIPFYPDLVSLFITHTETYTPDRVLSFEPSAAFSGLVIYVEETLPLFGKHQKGPLLPSLFPKIYDEEMNLLVEAGMIEPEIIKKQGMVSYTQHPDDRIIAERAGQSPLYIIASGSFGQNNSDIIIPTYSARTLLANQENMELIKKGKIVIIVKLP